MNRNFMIDMAIGLVLILVAVIGDRVNQEDSILGPFTIRAIAFVVCYWVSMAIFYYFLYELLAIWQV